MSSCGPSPSSLQGVLWLQTFHFSIPHNLWKITPGTILGTGIEKKFFLQDTFSFQIVKVSRTELCVYATRVKQSLEDENRDDGYFLRFQFSIIGFDDDPKTVDMTHDNDSVFVNFSLASACRTLTEMKSENYLFDLKVVMKMVETTSLENELAKHSLTVLHNSCKVLKIAPHFLERVGCLMKRPGLKGLFTGRLPENYYKAMVKILIKTVPFSHRIGAYLDALTKGDVVPPEFDVSWFLNYAVYSKKAPISNTDALKVYLLAHKLGMGIYKHLCSDLLSEILDNDEMVLEVIELALQVEDRFLFERAAHHFLKNFHDIYRSEDFEKICDTTR